MANIYRNMYFNPRSYINFSILIRLKASYATLFIFFISSGCMGQAKNLADVTYDTNSKTLTFLGPINNVSADAFEALDREYNLKNTKLTIRSTGGDAAAGIKIGSIIHRRDMDVTVNQYCMSGCASYIFLAGKKKSLQPDAIVAFHGTPTAIRAVISKSPLAYAADLFSESENRERAYYREIGVSEVLLDVAQLALDPQCVATDQSKKVDDVFH